MAVPTIITQPLGATVNAGDSATLRFLASAGGVAPDYQWVRVGNNFVGNANLADGPNFSGTGTNILRVRNFSAALAGLYACVASTVDGSVRSYVVAVLLTGMILPKIHTQPIDTSVAVGGTALLSIEASDSEDDPTVYQWSKNGEALGDFGPVSGAHGPALTITGVTHLTADFYQCEVSNSAGAVLSTPAGLTVTDGGTTYAPVGIAPLSGVFAVTAPTGGSGGIGTPIYSGAASAFSAFFGGIFSTDGVYPDGDWSVAAPDGMMWPEFPFAADGDQATVVCKQRYMQAAQFFQPTPLGTTHPHNLALLLIAEDNFKIEGGGIVSWIRTYATQPAPRDVFESHGYGFQYFDVSGESNTITLTEYSAEVTSRVRCEYYHVRDRASWPTLLAPRIVKYGNYYKKRGQGSLAQDAENGFFFISDDAEILAEDSRERMWKYPFMERRTRYIAGPTRAFWGSALTIIAPPLTTPEP